TWNSEERDILVTYGWSSEGTAWKAPEASNAPVYRVYNPNSGEHHYTTNVGEKDFLVSLGWKNEGIGWYSDDSQGTPVYRLYNPNAAGQYEAGGHHYTKDVNEKNSLIAAGWSDEGIGWYGR
ncbi:MAG: mannosyl-glycoprotein endo-beta-N-acetylglucosamidase, partial [Lachnospiraceae bacterium]|nr:mannosyl-glycoprotein endo-beta-N-acetylglucosamidase [Lachnospiraceae bacterium]